MDFISALDAMTELELRQLRIEIQRELNRREATDPHRNRPVTGLTDASLVSDRRKRCSDSQ